MSVVIKEAILMSAKGLWLSALFLNIHGFLPNISFDEQKELFFELVQEGLETGKIKFDYPPLEKYADKTGFWDADIDTIMTYLKDGFSKHATHEHDMDVNLYFYEIAVPVCCL